ncbi:MAG: hypothetical protein J7513_11525 [Solirubrobacteraceae bacterium]|nr:hypothetical protein [Solirubrobacteraceae bacterium]
MTLMPELQHQFRVRAQELRDAQHARRRRRRRHGLLTLAVTGTFVSASGAAAALGLWSPPLGGGDGPGPVAVIADPDATLRDQVGALRRPQTDADRSSAERYALRYPSDPGVEVLTNAVRRIGTTPSGEPVVIVPVRRGQEEELCMWVGTQGGRGAHTCVPDAAALDGRLVLGNGSQLDPVARDAMAKASRDIDAAKAAGRDPRPAEARFIEAQRSAKPSLEVVGLAPDAARTATVGGHAAAVDGNLFAVTIDERDAVSLRATFSR